MDSSLGHIEFYDSIIKKAIQITSDFPVSISAMNLYQNTTDASIVLPLINIPVATTYVTGHPKAVCNEILLVATHDSTDIKITPSNLTIGGHAKNTPYIITMQKGELYQIGSYSSLDGTLVEVLTRHKLVVYTGDACSSWPCGACDHQYEQLIPANVLDTAYCAPPHFGHTGGYSLKIITLDTVAATIKANGKLFRNVSRLNPLVIDVTSDSGFYVSSDKPFHCHQFMKGPNCSGYINAMYGDPSQLELISTKYSAESVIFSTVNSTNLRDHFVNIVIKTPSKNMVYLDKTLIDSSEFKPFPYNKVYSYACIKVSLGQHFLECKAGLLAYCYGLGFYESYLYLAGFSLPNFDINIKDSVLRYDCKNQQILMQFQAESEKPINSYSWDFGDNTSGTGKTVQHIYKTTGKYVVKLYTVDYKGEVDSAIKTMNISWPSFDPVRDKTICGFDTVTFEEKNPFFTDFKWQDNSTKSYFREWKNNRLMVTASDTTGYCKFIDSGTIIKIDIQANIQVDSIEKCFKYNLFKFKNNPILSADRVAYSAWVFPWKTIWDTTSATYHFLLPGKYKVYLDIYTAKANCKSRSTIDVVVHPTPKTVAKTNGEEFCNNAVIQFSDSSYVKTGYIDRVNWIFDDSTSIIIKDSFKTDKKFVYDPKSGAITRFYRQIAISDRECSDTALNAVMVWPSPKVDFTLTTNDTIKCVPAARWTFTSTTKVDQDTFSLLWNSGNGTTSSASSIRNIRYTTAGKYQVKLKALSPFGCHDSISKTIEVLDVPKADFYSPDSIQCFEDQAFKFIDSSKGKYLSYHWSFGNNISSSKPIVDSVTYGSPGRKKVTLKIQTLYAGCEDSVVHYVRVVREPKAAIAANKDIQCLSGNQFLLKDQSTYYQVHATSNWIYDALSDTSFILPAFSRSDTGNFNCSLIVTDIEGCTDTAFKRLRIIDQPRTSLSIDDSIQCFSDQTFVFRTLNSMHDTYTWKLDQKAIHTGTSDSLSYPVKQKGLHNIRLISENPAGCRDSISLNFRLLDPLKADFTIDKDSQCFKGHIFNISDNSKALHDAISKWNLYANNINYNNSSLVPGIQYQDTGNKGLTLVIMTSEGCIDSIHKTLVVLPDPDGLIIGDTVCLNQEARLALKQTAGHAATQWQWDLGDGNKSGASSVRHLYSRTGNYHVRLDISDQYGCAKQLSLNDAVIIYAIPDPAFTYKESSSGINQSRLVFKPNVFGLAYRWQFPDGSTNINDSAELLVSKLTKGPVSLRVTNSYGCVDSASEDLYIFPNNFSVYIPNAITVNADNLNDVFKLQGLGDVLDFKLSIMNRWGEQVFLSHDPANGWDGSYQGKPVPQDVYMYFVSFKFLDGKAYVFRGTLTVLN
jgi:gliding motility-associated-like protein